MCIKGPESWWIAKSITPQLVVNQSKINPPTFRSFDFYNQMLNDCYITTQTS